MRVFHSFQLEHNGPMDGTTDRRTGEASYKVASSRLKNTFSSLEYDNTRLAKSRAIGQSSEKKAFFMIFKSILQINFLSQDRK